MAEIAKGQATVLGNAPGSNRFLGFNSNSTLPLPIRNDGNQPIEFSTNQTLRMILGADGRLVFNAALSQNSATFNINALSGHPTGLLVNSSHSGIDNTAVRIYSGNATYSNTGARIVINSSPNQYNSGVEAAVNGATPYNLAVRASASNAQGENSSNFGVHGVAFNQEPPVAMVNYGVRGGACGARTNIGVYGTNKPLEGSCYADPGFRNYAGYFAGKVVHDGEEINPSDQNLKTDIEPLTGASDILAQLQPKTYNFLTDEYSFMGLPMGKQYGLISQEVQPILPTLVSEVTFPAQVNTQGEILAPEVNFLGLEYKPFIPILIAAFNEQQAEAAAQQATIATQNENIENLQEKIIALEDRIEDLMRAFQESQSIKIQNHDGYQNGAVKGGTTLKQNTPNPFDEQTVISFEIPNTAQVRLEISDASGRLIETLYDGSMEEGHHLVRWDAGSYPSGVYYYSLYSDTILLTKKMIKK